MASPRHCAGFWAEHVLRCDFMSSIPHSTLLDLPGGATLYSLLNFILSFIVFLIKPAHWPLVEWNLQDRWTLNICFFPQQRDPLAHLKNNNLSYKSNSLLLSICMHAFLFVFMFVLLLQLKIKALAASSVCICIATVSLSAPLQAGHTTVHWQYKVLRYKIRYNAMQYAILHFAFKQFKIHTKPQN